MSTMSRLRAARRVSNSCTVPTSCLERERDHWTQNQRRHKNACSYTQLITGRVPAYKEKYDFEETEKQWKL
jgi:hypothetical protein